ncbi:DUF4402 domain-containing protein [Gramella sp. KN1008]|uniref:DUF4402 domain-containing protein n=1 Tax=Gramella sp. KN1008 TaxID=2529298 RepID=UPI001A94CA71|nr:DUF4402 domain-containing protein [Gramella sp. KN1008]
MATVTIIEPVQIENTSNMNFASIDARKGGTVTLHPDNTRSSSGDVLLDEASGVSAASFRIKGQSGYSYNIIVPQNEILMSNGKSSLTLKDFTVDYQGLFNDNTETVRLGASLDVGAGQQPGNYRSIAPIEVTVSYN